MRTDGPGFSIERRRLVIAAVGAGGSLIVGRLPAVANEEETTVGRSPDLTEAEYVELVVPEARRLAEDATEAGQEAYLRHLATFAADLGTVPEPEGMTRWKQLDERIAFRLTHRGSPFIIVHWKLEPGIRLPAHPHPGGNVCTVGLEGEAWLTHYEVVGEPDYGSDASFTVARTRHQRLRRGDVSTLASRRDNIHTFIAGPEGARGLDVTTMYRHDLPTPFVAIDAQPTDAAREIYGARWVSVEEVAAQERQDDRGGSEPR